MRLRDADRPRPPQQSAVGISGAIILLWVGPPAGPAQSLPTLWRSA